MDFYEPKITDTAEDSVSAIKRQERAELESRLAALTEELRSQGPGAAPLERARLELELGRTLMGLERGSEAWDHARQAFDIFAAHEDWEQAADACDVLFECGQEGSLAALGQGIWLAVTFPMDPELTVHLLSHVVDETPDDSDGAAVAATTALYLVDMRTEGPIHEKLHFFAGQVLGRVARRHSDVETQEQFELWMERLELNDPDRFLPRLRNVVDVLVQDDWWFDRDEVQARLPVS
ncbi:MAG: hypothetical protein PVG98_00590 [Chromatiales bacterium]